MRLIDQGVEPPRARETGEALPPLAHLRCLLAPALATVYLALRPGGWWAAGFVAAPFLLDLLASRSGTDWRQPRPHLPARAFTALLYLLFALHWANLALAADLLGRIEPVSLQGGAAMTLLVISSALAAGAVGHELIHRRGRAHNSAGRLLLASMFYEHLFTEHLRGHHARAGTPQDPTTARLGESLLRYLLRAVPAQVTSALRLEAARLRGRPLLLRLLGDRVLQGFSLEAGLVVLWWALFGWVGVGVLVVQGLVANLLFQIVNYFQHWGVTRAASDPAGVSWDTSNKSTLFSMVGLARHADHHRQPSRPFQELRYLQESNPLPGSYGQVMFLAVFRNRRFRELLTAELRRRGRLPATD